MIERAEDPRRTGDEPARLGDCRRAGGALARVPLDARRLIGVERSVEPRVDGPFVKMLHAILVCPAAPPRTLPPAGAAPGPMSYRPNQPKAPVPPRSRYSRALPPA